MGRPWSIDPEFPNRARNFDMNASDWELYSSMAGPKMDAAVKDLNEQLFRLVTTYDDWKVVRDKMYKVMDKHIELGARDTEPEVALCDALEIHYDEETSRW